MKTADAPIAGKAGRIRRDVAAHAVRHVICNGVVTALIVAMPPLMMSGIVIVDTACIVMMQVALPAIGVEDNYQPAPVAP